jgi:hypothetical protein
MVDFSLERGRAGNYPVILRSRRSHGRKSQQQAASSGYIGFNHHASRTAAYSAKKTDTPRGNKRPVSICRSTDATFVLQQRDLLTRREAHRSERTESLKSKQRFSENERRFNQANDTPSSRPCLIGLTSELFTRRLGQWHVLPPL